jgi:hypothetical protein
MQIGVISPQDWGLAVTDATAESLVDASVFAALGASPRELERRMRANTYEWLPRQLDEGEGAFHGFYSAPRQHLDFPQTVNLIAPWQLLAAYDRYQDEQLLTTARRAADWFYERFVVTHPMSVVIGGVRDGLRSEELWTKFAAELVISAVGLYRRTGEGLYLDRARQSAGFLIQSARHDFSPKYNEETGKWQDWGWQSFGRVIEAFMELEQVTEEAAWGEHALRWGELGLALQAPDGSFYLIDDDYFNTDLAADELRALIFLYERTEWGFYLEAACHFAEWLLAWQREDGAWPLTIDRDGNVVVPTVGPGDVPNIAVALLRLHSVTDDEAYLQAALRTFRYSLSTQVLPESGEPYADDPRVQWGFWSWDPYYDYTLSGDQSTHHVRGMMFLLDYLGAVAG